MARASISVDTVNARPMLAWIGCTFVCIQLAAK